MAKLIETDISALVPDDKNFNKGTQYGQHLIEDSLRKFGAGRSGLLDRNNRIIAGNKFTENAGAIGMSKVIIVETDGTAPVYVKRTDIDLDTAKGREMALADNATGKANLDWDTDTIKEQAEAWDIKPDNWGVEIPDWEQTQAEAHEDGFTAGDDTPKVCMAGDIITLGSHRLMCGDSTSADDVARLMNGERADMVFTDPPYGYEYQSNSRAKTEKFDVLQNDDKILDFMPILKIYAKGFVFVCTTWKVLDKWLPLFSQHYDLTNMIIWNKGGGGLGNLKSTFATDYEIILCASNGMKITGKRLGSVWNVGRDDVNSYKHPTQKPIELSAMAIENTTNGGNIILDLFGGSGSTLMACEQLGRKCYMMELDAHYCDVIVQRWQDFTGKKAVIMRDGVEVKLEVK